MLPAQGSINTSGKSSRSIAMFAVILFALSGLISGFAVGGFLHSRSGQSSTSGSGTTSEGQTTGSSSSNKSHPTFLNPPHIELSNVVEKANGMTYTFTTQAVNRQDKPVQASDITCKLWLVQPIPGNAKYIIPDSTLSEINTIQNPIIGTVDGRSWEEEVSGLNFDSSTPQTHLCNANGQFIWKYQLSNLIQPGDYDLVVLTDWGGVHYNWSWINIDIK